MLYVEVGRASAETMPCAAQGSTEAYGGEQGLGIGCRWKGEEYLGCEDSSGCMQDSTKSSSLYMVGVRKAASAMGGQRHGGMVATLGLGRTYRCRGVKSFSNVWEFEAGVAGFASQIIGQARIYRLVGKEGLVSLSPGVSRWPECPRGISTWGRVMEPITKLTIQWCRRRSRDMEGITIEA